MPGGLNLTHRQKGCYIKNFRLHNGSVLNDLPHVRELGVRLAERIGIAICRERFWEGVWRQTLAKLLKAGVVALLVKIVRQTRRAVRHPEEGLWK